MSIIFKVILFVCCVPLSLQTHMPSSYGSFHCIDKTERQVAGRCGKQNSVPCYNPCTLIRDSAQVRQGSYFISEENVKASWYEPTLALKGTFKHI